MALRGSFSRARRWVLLLVSVLAVALALWGPPLRWASAKRITAVIPYYSYARSDKKDAPRISIAGRLIADLLQSAGANRVLTMDLHAAQIQGFFDIPLDHLYAAPVLMEYFLHDREMEDLAVVAPATANIIGKAAAGMARGARRPAAFVLLLGLLVPGLLVNTVLKPNWNRARPRNVVEFGGTNEFQPILSPPGDHERHSFPSGHVASASLMVAPAFLLRHGLQWLLGHVWGLATGYGRSFGRIAGALAATVRGAQPSLPTAAAVDAAVVHT